MVHVGRQYHQQRTRNYITRRSAALINVRKYLKNKWQHQSDGTFDKLINILIEPFDCFIIYRDVVLFVCVSDMCAWLWSSSKSISGVCECAKKDMTYLSVYSLSFSIWCEYISKTLFKCFYTANLRPLSNLLGITDSTNGFYYATNQKLELPYNTIISIYSTHMETYTHMRTEGEHK